MLYETQNPHGGDVYGAQIRLDFSSNVNPLGPPPSVISAMQRACAQVRQYPDPYCRALTRAIAAHEGVPERSILCGAGAAELIYAYCDALRPKKIAELAPTFSEYSAAAAHFGAKIVRFSLHAPDFTPDETLFSFLESEKPDLLFLCTPNSPTGRTIPHALLESVLQQCKKQHTHVLLDECFLDFTDEKSARDLLPQFENLLILKAFTKNFALAGARVGYCLTENHALLREMSQSCQPWNVCLPAQAAGVVALLEWSWVLRARKIVREERTFLSQELPALGFSVCPSEANYLLLRAPVGLDTALLRRGIAIRSCENYPGLGPGWYRIAVRLHEENEALLETMRRVTEEAHGI